MSLPCKSQGFTPLETRGFSTHLSWITHIYSLFTLRWLRMAMSQIPGLFKDPPVCLNTLTTAKDVQPHSWLALRECFPASESLTSSIFCNLSRMFPKSSNPDSFLLHSSSFSLSLSSHFLLKSCKKKPGINFNILENLLSYIVTRTLSFDQTLSSELRF